MEEGIRFEARMGMVPPWLLVFLVRSWVLENAS